MKLKLVDRLKNAVAVCGGAIVLFLIGAGCNCPGPGSGYAKADKKDVADRVDYELRGKSRVISMTKENGERVIYIDLDCEVIGSLPLWVENSNALSNGWGISCTKGGQPLAEDLGFQLGCSAYTVTQKRKMLKGEIATTRIAVSEGYDLNHPGQYIFTFRKHFDAELPDGTKVPMDMKITKSYTSETDTGTYLVSFAGTETGT